MTEQEKGTIIGYNLGWKAALEMVQRWYQEAREGRPQTFDLGLWDMLKKELDED